VSSPLNLPPGRRLWSLWPARAGLLEGLRAELMAAHPRLQVVALPVDLSDERDVDRCVAAVHDQVGALSPGIPGSAQTMPPESARRAKLAPGPVVVFGL
jgi:NAD(P)-dependent dehydrogenase (short-subunit alcohol dehydrogenase family)